MIAAAPPPERPPSVDSLARSLGQSGLPHAVLVRIAREAIASGQPATAAERAAAVRNGLLRPVINATGVLLHTNLGRAPLALDHPAQPFNVELDLGTGGRGSRQRSIGELLAATCGAEAAIVVNNNAAAVLLVLAAVAHGRGVAVSRGESVEIGGLFRIPDVMEQSGATLVDVGTTNRTRLADYAAAVERGDPPIAATLKVHPSNFHQAGFVEDTDVAELAALPAPTIVDIGSGLVDRKCPWLAGAPPAWLAREPAARQCLEDGAAVVTFSGDKLFGGPQAGIIAGRRDLVERCARHPLARALRPGTLVLAALQATALAYLDGTAAVAVPFWRMATRPPDELRVRALEIVSRAAVGSVTETASLPGAGSTPGASIPSHAVALDGDATAALRARERPIIARVHDGRTLLDLRAVDDGDDVVIADALTRLAGTGGR